MKKLTLGGWFYAAAAVLGVVGVIATYISSTISAEEALLNLPVVLAVGVLGVILAIGAICCAKKWGNDSILRGACGLGSIASLLYVLGGAVNQRVLTIAGLFSYNSQNEIGWKVFYACVVAWAAVVIGALLVVIAGFMKAAKED